MKKLKFIALLLILLIPQNSFADTTEIHKKHKKLPPSTSNRAEYTLVQENDFLYIASDVAIAGVQLETTGDWEITQELLPYGWSLQDSTSGEGYKKVMIYSLGGQPARILDLFSYTGNLNVVDAVVVNRNANIIPPSSRSSNAVLTTRIIEERPITITRNRNASTTIAVANINSYAGEENTLLPINISTTDSISGIQFTLQDTPDWLIATSSELLVEGFHVFINDHGSSTEVILMNMSGGVLPTGDNIPLLNLYYDVSTEAEYTEVIDINIANLIAVDPDAQVIDSDSINGSIRIGEKGDLNIDGEINIIDIVMTINIALYIDLDPTSYELWSADINNDGFVNIIDIMTMINIALSSEDTTPPIISNIQTYDIATSTASISWLTDEDSTSIVKYATSTMASSTPPNIYTVVGTTTATSTEFFHQVELDNLYASSTYYYIVESEDISGNVATSTEQTFITEEEIILPPDPDGITRVTYETTSRQERPVVYGDKIAWVDYRNGNADIYLYDMNLSTSTYTQITSGLGDESSPSISDNYLVYQDHRLNPDDPEYTLNNIYLLDLETRQESLISNNNYTQSKPMISGDNVLFKDNRTGSWNLFLYNIASSTERQISFGGSVSQSYIDGSDIVWSDNNGLKYYDLNTDSEQLLIPYSGSPFYPSIHDRKIVSTYRQSGQGVNDFDIYVYDLDTGIEQRLTSESGSQPGNLSIYNNYVVWTDTTLYDIFFYDLNTNVTTRLTSHPSQQMHSFINGNTIVWADARNHPSGSTNHDIYYYIIP